MATKSKVYLQYVGISDIRLLGVDDVGADLEFRRNVPTEVSKEIATAILEHPGLVGEFEETSETVAPDSIDDSTNQGEPIPGL